MSSDVVTTSKGIDRSYLLSRLGSLLGLLPLGVWTVAHLWSNLAVFDSGEAWQKSVTEYRNPIAFFVTSVIALLPLALHSIWGIGRLLTTRPNAHKSITNLRYILQRASAVGVLLFLGAHLYKALIEPRILEGHPEPFQDIAKEMAHHGPTITVYVLGVLGVCYHLANGLHTFCMGWGVVSSQAALKKLNIVIYVVFAILLAMGWGAIYGLFRAGQSL